jgi:predicted MFS family arabinose efflux permease
LLYAAPGAGALLCAATSGWIGRVERQGRAVLAVVGIWGLAMIGFGLSRSVPLAIAFLMLGGAADMVSAVLRTTMVQLSTPDQLRGRVASVNKAVVSGGPLIGDAEAGAVAELTSTAFSVVSGGVLSIVGMLLIWWRYPDFSRVTVGNGTITIAGKPDGTDVGAARGP